MDPSKRDYWRERRQRSVARGKYRKDRLAMLKAQGNTCGYAAPPFGPETLSTTTTLCLSTRVETTDWKTGCLRISGAITRTTSDMDTRWLRLEPYDGKPHIRFLGGGIVAMRPCYPGGGCQLAERSFEPGVAHNG